jgi:hypothetical protein
LPTPSRPPHCAVRLHLTEKNKKIPPPGGIFHK